MHYVRSAHCSIIQCEHCARKRVDSETVLLCHFRVFAANLGEGGYHGEYPSSISKAAIWNWCPLSQSARPFRIFICPQTQLNLVNLKGGHDGQKCKSQCACLLRWVIKRITWSRHNPGHKMAVFTLLAAFIYCLRYQNGINIQLAAAIRLTLKRNVFNLPNTRNRLLCGMP